MRHLASFGCGFVFGLGLLISQMTNPAKVLGFLDLFGAWDPSLALVMVAALAVTLVGYRVVLRQPAPRFAPRFELPSAQDIDARLAAGAVLFGAGWGLAGLCPGPAITALIFGGVPLYAFLIAMAIGMAAVTLWPRGAAPPEDAPAAG